MRPLTTLPCLALLCCAQPAMADTARNHGSPAPFESQVTSLSRCILKHYSDADRLRYRDYMLARDREDTFEAELIAIVIGYATVDIARGHCDVSERDLQSPLFEQAALRVGQIMTGQQTGETPLVPTERD